MNELNKKLIKICETHSKYMQTKENEEKSLTAYKMK